MNVSPKIKRPLFGMVLNVGIERTPTRNALESPSINDIGPGMGKQENVDP
jgi:hypothetical protein